MKKLLFAVIAALTIDLSGAVALPDKWEISFFKLDERSFLKGLSVTADPQPVALSEKVLNLDTIAQGADSAAIRGVICTDKAQTVWLGIGSKLFSLSLNGKMIYDFRQYGLGYDVEKVCVRDHVIPLELQAGRNEILFNTRRTSWRYDYCYGKERNISWDLALKILADYQPVKAELAHPEMALRPDRRLCGIPEAGPAQKLKVDIRDEGIIMISQPVQDDDRVHEFRDGIREIIPAERHELRVFHDL